jgi:D-3-phosphoglycerate dehydrogenase
MQLAGDRGLDVSETHEKRSVHTDSVRLELQTDAGVTRVEGAVVLDKPRLVQVDGISCEAPLEGHITFLKNQDVPGVVGYVGGVLGKNNINIASFSLGRKDALAEAVSVIVSDQSVPDAVLNQLLENKALTQARSVEFSH